MLNRMVKVAAIALLSAAAGCVNDNGGGAVTPPTLDASFVGYSNPDTKQTTCGNCHIEKQRDWSETHHADAWQDLPSSSQTPGSTCAPCHTTNGSSNLAPDSAGYTSVAANAKKYYQDVQCEACHGPGAGHVVAPDDAQPLTTIASDTGLAVGCGTCHSGTHNPFVNEWRSSRHGIPNSHTAGNASCAPCHNGSAAIRRFDPNSNFTEATNATWTTLGCAVCHDPHGGTPNAHQLRLSISDPNLETNLCMQCHYRRSVPDPTSSRGPHAPQGPLLLGEAGWRPSTFTYDSMGASSHGTTANPRLCVTCHMQAFDVTAPGTGTFVFHSTGHSFRPIPCVVAGGMPDTTNTCDVTARSFRSCVTSGCHSSESVARNAFTAVEARMELYSRTLHVDVNGNGNVDAFPTDSGMVAIVKRDNPSELVVNSTITVAEGALFNARMMVMPGNGVHNPFYGEALLIASINEMRTRYALPVPPAVATLMRQRAPQLGMRAIP